MGDHDAGTPRRGRPPKDAAARDATLRRIEAAAAHLFREEGYAQTTVEQIAAAADISLRTFYRYCTSKDDALTGRLSAGALSLADLIAREQAESFAEAVVAGFHTQWTTLYPDLDVLREQVFVLSSTPPLRAAWIAAGRDAQSSLAPVVSARLGVAALEADVLAGGVIAALTSALEWWAAGRADDLEQTARRCVAAVNLIPPASMNSSEGISGF